MTPRLDLDDIINILFENACVDFRKMPQYKLLWEKQIKMDEDCETMLGQEERDFVQECFDIMNEIDSEKLEFVYRQGFKDCVSILKKLEVL